VSDLQLSASERAVITTILRPSHPVMDALREQLEACLVTNREFTGTGFFTTLHVPDYVPDAPVTRESLHLGEVAASLTGLDHGAGFVLWVVRGRLDTLEGFSYGERWPDGVEGWDVTPMAPTRGEGVESDLEQVANAWRRASPSG
jgi:hypothetical protein